MEYIFNPTILQNRYFVTQNCSFSPERTVSDYEIDFYISGEREMWVDDIRYKVGPGSLIIRTPGQKVYGKGDYDCYMLTLDFSNRHLSNYKRNKATEIQAPHNSPIWNILPTCFTPLHYDDYIRIFRKLTSINIVDTDNDAILCNLINELLHLITADYFQYCAAETNETRDFIDEVCSYIKLHYSEKLTLDDLSEVAHINKNYLIRKFKKKFNISPISYLMQYRLDVAKKLLTKTDIPIKSIAIQCGFNDYSYFCMAFRKTFSVTPTQFRKRHINST